ncbi:MAG: hypothetical protein LBU05_03650, partial [Bifidobacteriaceae bacterium]|nr:hypothetical protein [Bifidobacteriaceae bacterium]
MSTEIVPAIDLGGTFIKGGLVGPGAVVNWRRAVPTGAAEGHRAVVQRLGALGRDLAAQVERQSGARPGAVGV